MPATATPPATTPAKPEGSQMRRTTPFDVFDTFQDEMSRLWGQGWPFTMRPLTRRMGQETTGATMWEPRIDVFEKDGSLMVKAELPGASREDIQVTLDQGTLVIRGERKGEKEVKEEHYYRMERTYGSFYRRVPIPFETTAEQITATYKDGVLEVQIPKPTESQQKPDTITVT